MSPTDTRALRSSVRVRAQGRCEYCHLPEEVDFARYEIDHIIADQHGGQTVLENLAYACFDCKRSGHYEGNSPQRSWTLTEATHDGGGGCDMMRARDRRMLDLFRDTHQCQRDSTGRPVAQRPA